ncbi:hypothetical protein L207DRAFT_515509 [Hyaloscypha variabilis F]|uniref:Cora-domain-containing protein n=1 Tax=Hyaloscypha variabilis (strain UAMH 11265 / GT02V1 / F) TaxID=1149755 RepID=A0A2J6RF04_HYAVF|nr:hypothetical protein L207DRAFT_515509 [Hyaloscypha variabilis F]
MGGYENKFIPADLEKGATVNTKRQDGAETILPSAYYDNVVKARLQDSPWLESLTHFMDPNADGFAMDSLNDHRMKHFDIKVMHFLRSQKPSLAIRCYTLEDFESAMKEEQEKRIGTIIIAKGISHAMIEALGTKFELEPDFFADYLLGTEYYRMGRQFSQPPDRAPNFLLEYVRKAPFYTAEFRRPLHMEGYTRKMIHQLRISNTTTPRGVTFIHDNLPDVFSAEKISVYKRLGSKIGIILTDQPLSDCPPVSHISIPVTSLEDQNFGIDRGRHQVSTRREIISWLQDLTANEVNAIFNDSNQLALQPVLKIVEKGSAMFLNHIRYLMQRILVRVCDEKFPDSTAFFLEISRSLEAYIYIHQKLMCSVLRVAKLRGGDDITEIERDFSYLADDLEFEVKVIKENVRFFVAEASIQEGKRVGWLSKLATVFLPVTLLATILSINDLGHTKWAILGGLGVPFVLILIFLMFSKRSMAYFSVH